MIHLIYIYFIVNAFCFGVALGHNERWYWAVLMLLFGLPFCIIYTIVCLFVGTIGALYRNLLIHGWYKLYFTNYFSKMNESTIAVRRNQYFRRFNEEQKHMNSGWYARFFLRQLDKKYNYGITRKEDENDV